MIKQVEYTTCDYVSECGGCGPMLVGDHLTLAIQPVNPLWPESIQATLTDIDRDSCSGEIKYTFEYISSDLPEEAPDLLSCVIKPNECSELCEGLQILE